MKFIKRLGVYASLVILVAVLGWLAIFMLAPLASSAEIAADWDRWLVRVAYNWPWVIAGCVAFAAALAGVDLAEEKERRAAYERR